ncbi:hypothetical protein DSECCO2_470590 [anaerobic digester metagenome]
MVDPRWAVGDLGCLLGQVRRVGGLPRLVGHHPDGFILTREVPDRLDEVLAVPAEKPGGPDDPVVVHVLCDLLLAAEFRGAVDIDRVRFVGLDVFRLCAVKDVVGAVVDEHRAHYAAGGGDVTRCVAVDGKRRLGVVLAPVDVRVRRRVDDEVGLHLKDIGLHRGLIDDIEVRMLAEPGAGEDRREVVPQHAAGAEDQDAPFCLLNVLYAHCIFLIQKLPGWIFSRL